MEDLATMEFCGIAVFDYDSVDVIEGHFQYNNTQFHLFELRMFDGSTVEVYDDWKVVIWGDEGKVEKEFYIMQNEEFKRKLYEQFPLDPNY